MDTELQISAWDPFEALADTALHIHVREVHKTKK